jgi:hypothetical protein
LSKGQEAFLSLIILCWYEAHKTILVGPGYFGNILLRVALPLFEREEDAVPFPQETWGLYRERTSAFDIRCGGFYAVIRVGRVPTKEAFFREDKKAEMPTEVALPLDESQRDAATCLQRFPLA